MDDIELIEKYVIQVDCPHCKGTGKCSCSSCKRFIENGIESTANFLGVVIGPNPDIEPTKFVKDLHMKNSEKAMLQREDYLKSKPGKSEEGNCQRCAGQGILDEIDRKKLDAEVSSGTITKAMGKAIFQKVYDLMPDLNPMKNGRVRIR